MNYNHDLCMVAETGDFGQRDIENVRKEIRVPRKW